MGRFFILSLAINFAALAGPAHFSYQGRLFDSVGNPLDSGSATVVLQILNPATDCLLYEESHTLQMNDTQGFFKVNVGLGTQNTTTAPNFSLPNSLANTQPLNHAQMGCAGYTPGSGDHRLLRVWVDGEKLSPDHVVSSVPYAQYANESEKLGGKTLATVESEYQNHSDKNLAGTPLPDIQATPLVAGDSLRWDGSKWEVFQAAPADLPTNSVTLDDLDFASNTGINLPHASVNPGSPTAGQMYYNTVSNKMMVYDGSTWVEATGVSSPWSVSGSDVSFVGGNVGVGTATPDASALLDVSSTTKGFLPPRMTTTERDAVASPAEGLTVFNTTTDKLNVYAGGAWTEAGSGGSFGTGNSGFVGSLQYAAATSCAWTSTSSSFANFGADTDCSNPTVAGAGLAPDTAKTPAIKIASLPAGRYLVNVYGGLLVGNSGACFFRLSDGTNNFGFAETATDSNRATFLSGIVTYSSAQTNLHIQIQSRKLSGTNCRVISDSSDRHLNFEIVRVDGQGSAIELADNDGNTKVQVEKNADENIIRFDTAGTERMTIAADGSVDVVGSLTAGTFVGDASGVTNIGAAAIADGSITVADVDFASSNGINIPQLASDPGSPTAGQMYYNTSTNKMMIYNGSAFVEVGSGAGGVASSMVVGFPDAIRCDSDVAGIRSTLLLRETTSTTVTYVDIISSSRNLVFSLSGNYSSNNALSADCTGFSVSQLRSSGQAFNFVGGQAIANDADNDTKIQVEESSDEDIIRFDTAGTERMVIDGSGNVGVGTASPQSALEVDGYIQLDAVTTTPPVGDCDTAAERGRARVDTDDDTLYVCTDNGWQAYTAGGSGTSTCSIAKEIFTTSGTWNKPVGCDANQRVIVEIWGGGGGGSSGTEKGGGGGGAYHKLDLRMGDLGMTETVTVGAGGAVNSAGGTSSFGSFGSAFGGGGGSSGYGGGGGGGINAAGEKAPGGTRGGAGGGPVNGIGGQSDLEKGESAPGGGGGGAKRARGGGSSHGGGGGGGGTNIGQGGNGGDSIYGGGGGGGEGGGGGFHGAGGISIYGGNGGAPDVAGTAPGGGGGQKAAGARGEVRVTVIP